MDIFVTLVHGLNLAAIYGLMAIGISLLWSSIGMINMAHGATFAVSGYAAWAVADLMKPILLAAFGKTAMGTAAKTLGNPKSLELITAKLLELVNGK